MSKSNIFVAAMGYDGVALWDTQTGKLISKFSKENIYNIDLSNNESMVAGNGYEESILAIWHVPNGEVVKVFDSLDISYIRDFAFSPNDEYIIIASRNSLSWLRISDGVLYVLGSDREYQTVSYSPDNSLLAVALKDSVELRDPTNNKELFRIEGFEQINNIAWSPDSKILAVADRYSDKGITLWHTSDGTLLKNFPQTRASSITFSPDQRMIVWINEGGRVGMFEIESGQSKLVFTDIHSMCGSILCATYPRTLIVFSPSGHEMITANLDEGKLWYTKDFLK